MSVEFVNQLLAILTIVAQILIFGILIIFFLPKNVKYNVFHLIQKNNLKLVFLIALISTLGSLFYSDIAGYEPCKLCWYQRIFMYPQVLLSSFALYKKENSITPYLMLLSLCGGVIAFYHYLLQLGIAPSLPCAAVGYSVSCSQRFVLAFDYITIPLMAFTAFLFMFLILLISKLKLK